MPIGLFTWGSKVTYATIYKNEAPDRTLQKSIRSCMFRSRPDYVQKLTKSSPSSVDVDPANVGFHSSLL